MDTTHLVIDGNNLLHAWKNSFGRGQDFDACRRALARRLDQLGGRLGATVTLVFDGTVGGRDEAYSGTDLEVLYASAALTADTVIEQHVSQCRDVRSWLVVSNDHALRRTVAASGADTMSCGQFIDLLGERAQKLSVETKRTRKPFLGPRLGDFFPD